MDTGVDYLHPDLADKWRGGANSWYDPNGEHATPYDANGHGTGVMGILVGGTAGGTAIGVAPGAQWIAVKLFDDTGEASESDIHLGLQWFLDPDGNPDTDDVPFRGISRPSVRQGLPWYLPRETADPTLKRA
jgi:bacillopeptidase F